MLDAVVDLVEMILKVAPEIAPKVEPVISEWGKLHNIPTDRLIRVVRAHKFDEVDARIDKEVDGLDIPD